ncbi:helix-turn-helix domain-containing protein [Pleomorphomonas oryzae]|uniref:helix-turn-helix domain-containing protein n=1 Tax=Pleomorphomonas oryzae TaxID=261934 RepID=UPI00047ADEA1|nr:helix-turn-helix transcriptional regulator [Pleomorphomonas oryzae]
MAKDVDQAWFMDQLKKNGKSLRGLAKHMDVDPSGISRMFSGQRKMKVEEVSEIALFLGVHTSEVLKHAGVAYDLDGAPTRILLASTIDEHGNLSSLHEARPLPQSLIDRAQSATRDINSQIIAAQVRASSGPLTVWDDAVILFQHTDVVDSSAIGQLSICRASSGEQFLARVIRARKTGEALIVRIDDIEQETMLVTATPVLAVLP